MKQSNILDHVGVFSRSIEDLAFVTKEIIKKDPQDKSTVSYSVSDIMNIVKSKPAFDPQFVFFKTTKWKNLDKESAKSFEAFIKKLGSNVTVIDAPSTFDKIFEYHQIIHESDMAYTFSHFYQRRKAKLGKKLVEAYYNNQRITEKLLSFYDKVLENENLRTSFQVSIPFRQRR